jgi:hypothetical protein
MLILYTLLSHGLGWRVTTCGGVTWSILVWSDTGWDGVSWSVVVWVEAERDSVDMLLIGRDITACTTAMVYQRL